MHRSLWPCSAGPAEVGHDLLDHERLKALLLADLGLELGKRRGEGRRVRLP